MVDIAFIIIVLEDDAIEEIAVGEIVVEEFCNRWFDTFFKFYTIILDFILEHLVYLAEVFEMHLFRLVLVIVLYVYLIYNFFGFIASNVCHAALVTLILIRGKCVYIGHSILKSHLEAFVFSRHIVVKKYIVCENLVVIDEFFGLVVKPFVLFVCGISAVNLVQAFLDEFIVESFANPFCFILAYVSCERLIIFFGRPIDCESYITFDFFNCCHDCIVLSSC